MSKQSPRALVIGLAILATAGCATYQEERDTTQPAKLQKAAFADGPWYTLRTVIDSPYEASFTFIGEAGSMEKIQWDIQEGFLYAYRTYEFATGEDAARKARDGDRFRGEPIAAYAIQSHFDLWHQYNPTTGEELPIIYEAQERPWYEREYMRVDWSMNHIAAFNFMGSEFCEASGVITKSPVAYAPTKPGDPLQVYFGERNGDRNWTNHYDLTTTHELGKIDYIDVVNREFAHLEIRALLGGIDDISCIAYPLWPLGGDMQITYRQSFMKMDPARFAQAEKVYYPDPAFEKFGYFRDERFTYDPQRGTTDFLGYQMHRWNIWDRSFAEDGSAIPIANRTVRPIEYYLNAEAPKAVRDVAHELITKQSWNRAFASALAAAGHPSMNQKNPTTTPAAELPQVFVLKDVEMSCGPGGDLACQQLGDLRYSFMYYVDRPSMGSPLGYGPSFSDPDTGEIISAVANFYGASLDSMRGTVGDTYDLIKGNISEQDVMTGENVRQYFQNQGVGVLPPTFPQVNLDLNQVLQNTQGQAGNQLSQLPVRAAAMKDVLDDLKRNGRQVPTFDASALAGGPIERMLLEADSRSMIATRVNPADATRPLDISDDAVLDKVSPLRNGGILAPSRRAEEFWSRGGKWDAHGAAKGGCVMRADVFEDLAYEKLIADAEAILPVKGFDLIEGNGDEVPSPTKNDVVDFIIVQTFRAVEEHEVGHTLGLRHNFEGTYDEENYKDEYWDIANQAEHQEPTIQQFDTPQYGGDGDTSTPATFESFTAWRAAMGEVKKAREAAGIDFVQYSSIMDYSMNFTYNDIMGIGKYDHAAIKFGYAGTVEVYKDPANKGARRDNRMDVPYFLGGERCAASSECAANATPFTVNGRQYAQQCRTGVSHAGGSAPLGAGVTIEQATGETIGVCSTLSTELNLGEFVGWTVGSALAPVASPNHRFCSDERVEDRPFCTRYDEGKTAVEVVQNQIDAYNRNYIFTNFRRYRATFEPYFYAGRLSRTFTPIGKIYQSMLYQLYYTPGFYQDPEKGFADFLQASIVGLNFMGQVLASPDVSHYKNFQPQTDFATGAPLTPLLEEIGYGEVYQTGTLPGTMYVPLGIGKHLWTKYELGYYGAIYRTARIGTFYDKLAAIEALSTRYWGAPKANDETYPISFYDGFRPELLNLFGGMATDDSFKYGPMFKASPGTGDTEVVSQVKYRNLWTGRFFDSNLADWGLSFAGPSTFGPQPGDEQFTVADPGGSFILRLYSIIYALQDFPVFYDNTFPGYVQLSSFGTTDPRHVEGVSDPNTITHFSPKYRKLYAASNTDDDQSFTFSLVNRARQNTEVLERVRDPATSLEILATHPRCQGQTGEDCRDRLEQYYENQIESVETTLNFIEQINTALGN